MTNYITDSRGNPLTTRIVIQPFTPTTVFGSTNVVGHSVGLNSSNGFWSANLTAGWYYVAQGAWFPKIPIFVTLGYTGTNSLAYFASAATNPIPTFGYSGNAIFTNTDSLTISNGLLVVSNGIIDLSLEANQFVRTDNSKRLVSTLDGKLLNELAPNRYYLQTNYWPGPTNFLDSAFNDYYFTTYTHCEVLGMSNVNLTFAQGVQLSILNGSDSNVFVTLPLSAFLAQSQTNAITLSNAVEAVFWFKVRNGRTNCIWQLFPN